MNADSMTYLEPRNVARHCRRFYSAMSWDYADTAAMYRTLLRDATPRHRGEEA